jgi:hypothetical protein
MSSFANIFAFFLTTGFYYIGLKPTLTYDIIMSEPDKEGHSAYISYIKNGNVFIIIYFLLTVIIQFIVNTSIITSNCGGSVTENLGAAALYTFIPWIFIFGILMMVIIINPGFKSVFSDVIGYFFVSYSANKIITDLLIDRDLQNNLKNVEASQEQKESLQNAADAIIKICGNVSILINQIVPSNFKQYLKELEPLMKDKYKNSPEGESIKKELFDLIVTRDNIGEVLWYVYTGILLTSIVQLQITTRGCVNNQATMEQNYKTFLANEQQAQQEQAKAQSTTYTLS